MLAALGTVSRTRRCAGPRRLGERFLRDGDRPASGGLPVADLGHGALRARTAGGRVSADDPRLQAAGSWLLGEEVAVRGDWAIRRPILAPGGWSFEFDNDLYLDVDDTAVVALALRELELGDEAVAAGSTGRSGCSRERRLGPDADNEACGSTGFRSATSAGDRRATRRRDRARPRGTCPRGGLRVAVASA
jgi:hypothetical protein